MALDDRDTAKIFPKRVLVVEDDDAIANALENVLLDEGIIPVSAPNGREALVALASLPNVPGLVLLDLMMPAMDGPAFVQEMRADDRWIDVPVVVVSAHVDAAAMSTSMGAVACLRKPFHLEALIDVVRAHYRRA